MLDDPDDVFELAWVDLEAFMRSWWDGKGARALVADRKTQRETWRAESTRCHHHERVGCSQSADHTDSFV